MDSASSCGSAKRKFNKHEDKATQKNLSIENEKQKEIIEDLVSELEEERNASSLAANQYLKKISEIEREARNLKRSAQRKMENDNKEILGLKDELNEVKNRGKAILSLTTQLQSSNQRMMGKHQKQQVKMSPTQMTMAHQQEVILASGDKLTKMQENIESFITQAISWKNRLMEKQQIRLKKVQEQKVVYQGGIPLATLFTTIKVAREEDLRQQIGKDIYFDLVDHHKVRSFHIQKRVTFNLFKDMVAKEFGIPVEFQEYWIWVKRENRTFRPHRPLTRQEETQTVGELTDDVGEYFNTCHAELKLFLAVEHGQDLSPIPPPDLTKEDILLFFKLYDPHKEELRYVGRVFVKSFEKPSEILTILNKMAGFASDEEIELFEELKYEPNIMCEKVNQQASFRCCQIEDGDIICFQKKPKPEIKDLVRFSDVPSYLEHLKVKQKPIKIRN